MVQSRFLGRAITFGLVLSSVGSCWTNASAKGDPVVPVRPPLIAAEPWREAARSKWVNENWNLYQAALAKAGLSQVLLDGWLPKAAYRNEPRPPFSGFGPDVLCKVLENLPDAPPRLLYGPSDKFAVSADGKVHCLLLETGQALGLKKESVAGPPPNCMGGAQQPRPVEYHLYVIPEGVSVGDVRTVRVSYYDLDIRYAEGCPLVPSARQ